MLRQTDFAGLNDSVPRRRMCRMHCGGLRLLAMVAAVVLVLGTAAAAEPAGRPNVVIILADDLGYGDLGVHGCRDIPTPHVDSIAAAGVRFTNGYVSAPQCAPTRAGLLTGRYQQRFGYDFNTALPEGNLPLSETTLADRFKAAGYATGLVGKWHLGLGEAHHPQHRGFDEFFGFLGGANPYLPQGPAGVIPRIVRGREPLRETGYLTDAFGREAVAFIERHRERPFFLYLAFNAPHGPLQASEKYLARFESIADEKRRTYAAMVSAMDDAVGAVLDALRSAGLEDNTLVVFLSDNGGPTEVNASRNDPLRGVKGETREGGIRVPFFVQWKSRLPAGAVYEQPVIQLDLVPTALAAAGIELPDAARLDGVNLLPYLAGEATGAPHEVLYWRFSFPRGQPERHKWAIREGDWKLLTDIDANRRLRNQPVANGNLMLVDLANDIGERTDLAERQPGKFAALRSAWERWNAEMAPPGGEHGLPPRERRRPRRQAR